MEKFEKNEENERNEYQATLLKNRVQKKFRALRKWARKNLVTCFRLYDRDIPEIPLAIDLYEFLPEEIRSAQEAFAFVSNQAKDESQNIPGAAQKRLSRTYLKIFLYERPPQHQKSDAEEAQWLSEICAALSDALGIERSHIVCKIRRREKGGSQYSKENSLQGANAISALQNANPQITGNVFEGGPIFFINLSDYIDTGLFLDMRKTRALVKSRSQGKRVLNLFCYTSSFSVAAAAGGAAAIESVDLSNTYLEWSKKNFSLNEISGKSEFKFFRSDVFEFLEDAIRAEKKFDMIILDPPTFSNSKKTRVDLDLNRDWSALANLCIKLLDENGALYFSTNSRRLSFDRNLLEENERLEIAEITQETLDADFEQKKPHRVWEIKKAAHSERP
ncbi:MAG: methyltransferase [Treponema sp.]|nr:methyltransferase [Treponema sp.]